MYRFSFVVVSAFSMKFVLILFDLLKHEIYFNE